MESKITEINTTTMGYDLYNTKDEYFRWSIWGWGPTLRLALAHGWEPMGSISPDIPDEYVDQPELLVNGSEVVSHLRVELGYAPDEELDWGGEYWSNAAQSVCTADAANLAKALRRSADVLELRREYLRERGLLDESDMIDGESPRVLPEARQIEVGDGPHREAVETYLSMLDEDLSDGRISRLREFADYCDHGAFRIY